MLSHVHSVVLFSFVFSDASSTNIHTLSLHDALPIYVDRLHGLAGLQHALLVREAVGERTDRLRAADGPDLLDAQQLRSVRDRKSTRLNSSHVASSYAGFCLRKKNC